MNKFWLIILIILYKNNNVNSKEYNDINSLGCIGGSSRYGILSGDKFESNTLVGTV